MPPLDAMTWLQIIEAFRDDRSIAEGVPGDETTLRRVPAAHSRRRGSPQWMEPSDSLEHRGAGEGDVLHHLRSLRQIPEDFSRSRHASIASSKRRVCGNDSGRSYRFRHAAFRENEKTPFFLRPAKNRSIRTREASSKLQKRIRIIIRPPLRFIE